MKQFLHLSLLILVFGLLAGCGDASESSKDAPLNPLTGTSGKGDSGSRYDMLGPIEFGGEVSGDFVRDGQNDAYIFRAEEGALITLDNSHKGTARALDSTMFLYGPLSADQVAGEEPLSFDDDDGYGRHARIKNFTIPARGEYLIILGTYLGEQRGHYRLTLACGSEVCVPPEEPVCAGIQTKDGCVLAPEIVISETSLQTNEERGSDTFEVHLTAAPTADVVIWIDSSDPDEAAVYPIKLRFCAPGFVELWGNCTAEAGLDPEQLPTEPNWSRSVTVTVYGVSDHKEDGDAEYELSFEVETNDADYAELPAIRLPGVNVDIPVTTDVSAFDGLQDDDLLQALHAQVTDHTAYGYSGQNSARTAMFSMIDVNDGVVRSLYTADTIPKPRESRRAFPLGINTEHTCSTGWGIAEIDDMS